MNNKSSYFFFVLAGLIFSLLSLHLLPFKESVNYTVVWIFSSLLFLLFSYLLSKTELSNKNIFILVLIGIFIRLTFISTTPIGSDDIYRYMWDGKTQDAGINPYLYKPLDDKLISLHSDILPDKMNFKEMKTIYFPLSQWLFYAGYKISGETFWGYKFLILLFELMTIGILYLLLSKLKLDNKNILLYALCPLPIVQFALDAHLDAFGLPLLLASFYFYVDKKNILASILLGLSFSIKPVGVILIPIFFLTEKRPLDRMKFLIIPFIAFGLQFIPYILSTNPFEAFLIYTRNWFYNNLVFNTLNSFLHNNQTSRLICSALLIVSLIPLYFSKKSWINKIYLAVILLMIFSPVVHPWYICWVAILIPVVNKWSGIFFISACSLTSLTILTYHAGGGWIDYWIVQLIEYIGLIILLMVELFFTRNHNQELLPNS